MKVVTFSNLWKRRVVQSSGGTAEPLFKRKIMEPHHSELTRSPSRFGPFSKRLSSLDALRGFDMFWIVGGDQLVRSLAVWIDHKPLIVFTMHHTRHLGWEGFAFWELIFPLFVFLSGVSMSFSLRLRLERGESKKNLYFRLLRRALLLIFLGMSLGLFRMDWVNLRPLSVLGLIGMANLIAGVVVINRGVLGQLSWAFGLLIGYHLVCVAVPVPDTQAGPFTPGGHLGGYLDRHILPGKLFQDVYDPEGTLSFFPAAAMVLLGASAGSLLRSVKFDGRQRVLILVCFGVLSLLSGYAWSCWFPIIKSMWSSSYIMVTAGWSLLLVAFFYLLIDLWQWRWLGFLFIPIGMNAITIYVARFFVDFDEISRRIFGGLASNSGSAETVVMHSGVLIIEWSILYFLYRQRIFFRV